jgi:acetyl esterase/lipase
MPTDWTELSEADMPVPMRVYRIAPRMPSPPLVLHLHGGAFVAGSLDAGRTVATLLADAGAVVASVDYPLAPAHPFPAALQSAYAALSWLDHNRASLVGKRSGLFVMGEEAGGNLAAGLALMARDRQTPRLAGQILVSPMLDPVMATCSMRSAHAGPVGCTWADGWRHYLHTADKAAHPYASPLGSSRLSGLPPALVLTAQDDLLRDESLSYARRLRESGVAVDEHVLAAPTGWPCALDQPAVAGTAWPAALRKHFADFFAKVLGPKRLDHIRHRFAPSTLKNLKESNP